MSAPIDVVDDPIHNRYVGSLDGQEVGFTAYRLEGSVLTLPHTVVPPEFGGRGYASAIVRYALDEARARGLQVRPTCPYVAHWIGTHPDYADLVVA